MTAQTEDRAILILGGGVMQLPAIRQARALGLRVHVADGNAACPGRDEADAFHHVDLRDRLGLTQAARGIPGLAAVFTAGTDFSSSVAWVAQECGLPGIPYEVSLDASDKARMRRRLAAHGVSVPPFVVVEPEEEPEQAARRAGASIDPPVVVKPADNMGSRGVRIAETETDIAAAIREARGYARNGVVVVEGRIAGREYSIDALVVDGTIYVTGVADRHIYFPPYFVELGHTIPTSLAAPERRVLEGTFRDAVAALGITTGAAKGDVFLDTRGPDPVATVGEIAARLSGGYMSGWTYPRSSGVDVTSLAIRLALGEHLSPEMFREPLDRYVAERAVVSAPGTVRTVTVPQPDDLGPDDEVFLRCAAGSAVAPPRNNVEKAGNVIAVGETRREAEDRAIFLLSRVEVRLQTGVDATDRYIFETGWRGRWARFAVTGSAANELDRRDPVVLPADGTTALVEPNRAVPVRPLLTAGTVPLELRYPGESAATILEDLAARGTIRLVDDGPAYDGAFWRAFVAAGRQGVTYLIDTIRERPGFFLGAPVSAGGRS